MRKKEEYVQVIDKVESAMECSPDFSESERAALHEVVAAWRGFVLFKKFGKWTFVALVALGTAVTSVIAAYNQLRDLFK